jgi:hypothetical protein
VFTPRDQGLTFLKPFASSARARVLGDRGLEAADILDRVLDLPLQEGGERPVGQAEAPPRRVEPDIDGERGVVGIVAQEGEPLGVAHDGVELVAVDDQKAAAVGGLVHRLVLDLHAAEADRHVVAQGLVVVAGNVDDVGALARLAQDLLDHIVMALRPIPGFLQAPAVDDVADQIERLGLVVLQEIEQQLGLAAACAKVDVGDPDGPETPCDVSVDRHIH